MKHLIFIILITFFINTVEAQNEKASYKFVRNVITSEKNEKIIYSDSITSDIINQIKDALFNPQHKSGFNLNTKEKRYVKSELNKMKKFVWSDSLFKNSILIKQDSINYAFGKSNKSRIDGWGYFNTHFGPGYYDFSKPIFIRNNTICIFYRGYHCGWLCGEGYVGIYVRKGNKWVIKQAISSWIS